MVGYINCGASQMAKEDQDGEMLFSMSLYRSTLDEVCIIHQFLVL